MTPPAVANDAFDVAAPQTDVGQGAIVELLERADGAVPLPFGSQAAWQPCGLMNKDAEPSRELAGGRADQRGSGLVAQFARPHMEFVG